MSGKLSGWRNQTNQLPSIQVNFLAKSLADLKLLGMELHSDFRECELMCEMLSTYLSGSCVLLFW